MNNSSVLALVFIAIIMYQLTSIPYGGGGNYNLHVASTTRAYHKDISLLNYGEPGYSLIGIPLQNNLLGNLGNGGYFTYDVNNNTVYTILKHNNLTYVLMITVVSIPYNNNPLYSFLEMYLYNPYVNTIQYLGRVNNYITITPANNTHPHIRLYSYNESYALLFISYIDSIVNDTVTHKTIISLYNPFTREFTSIKEYRNLVDYTQINLDNTSLYLGLYVENTSFKYHRLLGDPYLIISKDPFLEDIVSNMSVGDNEEYSPY